MERRVEVVADALQAIPFGDDLHARPTTVVAVHALDAQAAVVTFGFDVQAVQVLPEQIECHDLAGGRHNPAGCV